MNTQNLLCFCILTMTFRKTNEENNAIYNDNKKNIIPRNTFNKGGERPIHWKEEDTIEINWRQKWKNTPCSWLGKINIGKMSVILKAINRFNAIPVKIPMAFSTEIEQQKNPPQICMELQKTLKSQTNPKKEDQSWRYHTPWFQTTPWTYSNQNNMILAEKHTQWHRTENPEISPHTYMDK